MMSKIKKNGTKKLFLNVSVLGLLICLLFVQGAFALNSQNNKAINVLGYNLVDSDTLQIYFDKNNMTIDTSDFQFKVTDDEDSPVTISSISTASGTGIDASYDTYDEVLNPTGYLRPTGTTVTLNFSSSLDESTLYTVLVSRTITANNDLTVGEFLVDSDGYKCDRMFKFMTPDGSGDYPDNEIYISYMPYDMSTSNDVPVEGNVGFITDRPITDDKSVILNGMDLKVGGNSVVGDDCYSVVCVASNTGFFFPLTAGTSSTVTYDLDYSTTYQLYVPAFDGDSDYGYHNAGSEYFSTVAGDIPAKFTAAPTYSSGTLSWSAVTGASSYNIYVDSSKYWGDYTSADYQTSNISISFTPTIGTYVRIEAVDSNGNRNGLSEYLAQ